MNIPTESLTNILLFHLTAVSVLILILSGINLSGGVSETMHTYLNKSPSQQQLLMTRACRCRALPPFS